MVQRQHVQQTETLNTFSNTLMVLCPGQMILYAWTLETTNWLIVVPFFLRCPSSALPVASVCGLFRLQQIACGTHAMCRYYVRNKEELRNLLSNLGVSGQFVSNGYERKGSKSSTESLQELTAGAKNLLPPRLHWVLQLIQDTQVSFLSLYTLYNTSRE